MNREIFWARIHGSRGRGGKSVDNLQSGDRHRSAVYHRLRKLLFLQKRYLVGLRDTTPQCAPDGEGIRILGLRTVRVFTLTGRLRRRTGAICARTVCECLGPLKIENDLPDEKVLFLSDLFFPGYMAAENAQITEGDTVAVWGCGPVGQFTIASAFHAGCRPLIAIDRMPERLELARWLGAITVDYSEEDVSVLTALKDLTGGIGPDACIDAVGMEAHFADIQGAYDKVKTMLMMEADRPGCCGRRSSRCGRAERCRSRACTAVSSTKCRLERRSAKASP